MQTSERGAKWLRGARRLARAVETFPRAARGATMVEFAIVAAPILFLLFGIIEAGLVFIATYELENAAGDAARLVRTGQAQIKGMDAAALKSSICGEVVLLSNCNASLQLSVQSFSTFVGVVPPTPVSKSGTLNTSFTYSPGGSGDIVLLTAYYEWPLIPLVGGALGNMGDGNRLLQAAVLFRNEPFGY